MRFGIEFPFVLDPLTAADIAVDAEAAGWDGVFCWEGIENRRLGVVFDVWIQPAAIAMRTERLTIGTFLTPLPRRRPWKVAREAVSIDYLSGGRFILSAGLGAPTDGGVTRVGEASDIRTRAEKLDEGLEIVQRAWSGESFSFQGAHYDIEDLRLLPRPLQRPRIPIWVPAALGSERSVARALRYDGVIAEGEALYRKDGTLVGKGLLVNTPAGIAALRARAEAAGATSIDIIVEGETGEAGRDSLDDVTEFRDAGTTWWMETTAACDTDDHVGALRRRVREGPPRLERSGSTAPARTPRTGTARSPGASAPVFDTPRGTAPGCIPGTPAHAPARLRRSAD